MVSVESAVRRARISVQPVQPLRVVEVAAAVQALRCLHRPAAQVHLPRSAPLQQAARQEDVAEAALLELERRVGNAVGRAPDRVVDKQEHLAAVRPPQAVARQRPAADEAVAELRVRNNSNAPSSIPAQR